MKLAFVLMVFESCIEKVELKEHYRIQYSFIHAALGGTRTSIPALVHSPQNQNSVDCVTVFTCTLLSPSKLTHVTWLRSKPNMVLSNVHYNG